MDFLPLYKAAGAGGDVKPPVDFACYKLPDTVGGGCYFGDEFRLLALYWLKLKGLIVERKEGLSLVGELNTNAIVQILFLIQTGLIT